ncbi:hypothetical protein GCM10009087_17570 [Sphingomonas oligophenolica]|uniref:DUF2339 domain-containing protein n=1 Tax=Sphingomonas oligophenolica TaxID=301154 RepID=A0ABU9Y5P9_9SPHN
MTFILFIAAIALGVVAQRLSARVGKLETQVRYLHRRLLALEPETAAPPEPSAEEVAAAEHREEAQRRAAAVIRERAQAALAAPAIHEPEPDLSGQPAPVEETPRPPAREPVRIGFEALVGGKLPIWIGGAALVLAAFFLVRYSIENNLLGPGARVTIAGLFGLALVMASEGARRLPSTRDDPRIGQALAGAGVASLYGTLYVAAEIYHLIGAGAAFVAVVAVTIAGLALALRHGPPTAIMALIGGFAAPLVSGFDAGQIGPLLVYLGLLVAALFGLAIRRGWAWLALAACGGGFIWVNILLFMVDKPALGGVGGFVLLLAIGATLALPRTGATRPWLRLLPLLAGLLQLLVLAPALDFGPLAWGLYLVLSAAALWLGWRDATLAPGGAAALFLVLALLAAALGQGERVNAPMAAIAITLLFGTAGHLLARRSALWAGIAVEAVAGPVIIALALAHGLLPASAWAALLALAAIAAASLSWRHRDQGHETLVATAGLTGSAAAAALLLALAEAEIVAEPWRWPAWLLLAVALAAWSRRVRDAGLGFLTLAPILVTAMAMAIGVDQLSGYAASIATDAATPPLADLAAIGLLPALSIAAAAWLLLPGVPRLILGWLAFALGLAFIPALLPAPWHSAGLGLATAAVILIRPAHRAAAIAAGLTTLAFTLPLAFQLFVLAGGALLGNRLPYLDLPPLLTILRELTLPAALIGAALLRRRDLPGPWRSRAAVVLAAIAAITLYAIAKAPLAIATLPRFETLGFFERTAITQLVFAAAWASAARWPRISRALLILALGRFLWFDLAILNPVLVRQSVGGLPILNLATLDAALAAAWLWPLRADRRWRAGMLALLVVAVGVTVRQAMHGAFLTGGIGRTENWLYSAAFLGLALLWLGLGIRAGLGDLRIAGLALLTAVTLKVFLIDAAALEGILRILSFLGLGLALIGIGWAYGRIAPRSEPDDVAKLGPDPAG